MTNCTVALQLCTEAGPTSSYRGVQITTKLFFLLPREIPLFMGRLCLDSWIPILARARYWRPDILGKVGGIKNSSGPCTLDQVKWPFPKTWKRAVVNQSTGNSVWELLWKFWTYRNQRVGLVTPTKYEPSEPLIWLFVYWHQELYNVQ